MALHPRTGLSCAALLVASATATAQGGTPAYQATQHPVHSNASSLVLADLDGDGRPDAATTCLGASSNGTVSVLLGEGAGGFWRRDDHPVGRNPLWLAAGDLDEDGASDLVSADERDDTLSFLFGDGQGGFGAGAPLSTGNGPRCVLLADLNGDGHLDLASADFHAGEISIRDGDGAGGFGPRVPVRTGVQTSLVGAGDLDQDGQLELVFLETYFRTVGVLRRNGTGTFGYISSYPEPGVPTGLALADLTGDGRLDVATTIGSPGQVSVRPGDGAGGLLDGQLHALPSAPLGLVCADLDGDSLLDIATANPLTTAEGSVFLLRGAGAGQFLAPRPLTAGGGLQSLAVGDLDGDGWLDLAGGVLGDPEVSQQGAVTVLRSRGPALFPGRVELPSSPRPGVLRLEDMDGDGQADLIAAHPEGASVGVRLGDGLGGLGVEARFSVGSAPQSLAVGDLDGDGDLDVVTGRYSSGNAVALANDGGGGLSAPTGYSCGTLLSAVALGDLDGDGALDLVSSRVGSPFELSVRSGNGAGAFGPRTTYPNAGAGFDVLLADLDLDGDLDAAVAQGLVNGSALVSLGDGLGGFAPFVAHATGSGTRSIVTGDWNEDGWPDLATAQPSGLTLLLGDGSGAFPGRSDHVIGLQPRWLHAGDVNGDGHLDLVSSDSSAARALLLLGDGSGGFPLEPSVVGRGGTADVALGDLDLDGRLDLVLCHQNLGALSLLRNQRTTRLWYVDGNVPGPGAGTEVDPFVSLGAALDAAGSGDRVLIAPGTYAEPLHLDKGLELVGTAGAALTVLDGSHAFGVLAVEGGVEVGLRGLTLTRGLAVDGGGLAARGPGTVVQLDDCVVEDCVASAQGGGIFSADARVVVRRSTVRGNSAGAGGGLYGTDIELLQVRVLGNSAGSGGGLYLTSSQAFLANSLVADNSAVLAGGILHLPPTSGGELLHLTSCTVSGNSGRGIVVSNGCPAACPRSEVLENCIVAGNPGGDCFAPHLALAYSLLGDSSGATLVSAVGSLVDVDPRFTDPGAQDFRLSRASPAVDAGSNALFAPLLGTLTTDLRGVPRFLDDPFVLDTGAGSAPLIDMGALERGQRLGPRSGVPPAGGSVLVR